MLLDFNYVIIKLSERKITKGVFTHYIIIEGGGFSGFSLIYINLSNC